MDSSVFPFTLLHKPLYGIFKNGENAVGKNIGDVYADDLEIWVLEGSSASVYAKLEREYPEHFREVDDYGNQRTKAASKGAWSALRVVVPASFGPKPTLSWTAIPQMWFDIVAGKVRGKTKDDMDMVGGLIARRLAKATGDEWHVYGQSQRVHVEEQSRLFLEVLGANGKSWRSGGRGASWAEVAGDWVVPG